MKRVFVLVLLHEDEGIEDAKGVFSTRTKLKAGIKKMKTDLGTEDLEEGRDFRVYDVPFDET